jgi:hypothetical protein
MNQKLLKFLEVLYFRLLRFYIPSQSFINVFLHRKKTKKCDIVIRFW